MRTVLVDRWTDPDPCECYREYEIRRADGTDTGYSVRRVGIDTAELVRPDGETEYLAHSDLRRALPEARRVVAARLAVLK